LNLTCILRNITRLEETGKNYLPEKEIPEKGWSHVIEVIVPNIFVPKGDDVYFM